MVEQGVASPENIDLIARLSFGIRLPVIGPLETVDLGGLDLTLAIQSYLLPDLDRSTEPTQLVQDKVNQGDLGAKSGKGFFDWPADKHAAAIQRRDTALIEMVKWLDQQGLLVP